jgi:hypothetical protein
MVVYLPCASIFLDKGPPTSRTVLPEEETQTLWKRFYGDELRFRTWVQRCIYGFGCGRRRTRAWHDRDCGEEERVERR